MANKVVEKSLTRPLLIFFCAAPFLTGLYFEWACCAAALFLAGYLIYCGATLRQLNIPRSPIMYACITVVSFFLVSPLWAVDKGMTLFGAVKFLPLPLFCMSVAQINAYERRRLINTVPVIGAAMTAVSLPLSFVPVLKDYLLVSGRLAGFFQYSNTYAVYLLAGIIISVGSDWAEKKKLVIAAVLIAGIFMSGSRTVLIILAVAAVIYFVKSKNKKLKIALSGIFAAILLAAIFYALITKSFDTVGRFMTSSFLSSTFLGRLLYYKDALPVILHHPFGLGYMGYYFLQGSFQTGVYSVVDIHNDFLQILLDIGWIPFAVCIWALIKSLFRCDNVSKSTIAVILLHCLLDFDLQFIVVDFLLLLLLDGSSQFIKLKRRSITFSLSAAVIALLLWVGSASAVYYFKDYDLARKIYPAYTTAYINLMLKESNPEDADALADKIISINQSVSVAYSAKSRMAFADGNIHQMIEYKKQAISLGVYSIDEYREYREMLEIAEELYLNAGDESSAEYCRRCNNEIALMLEKVKNNTSKIAWMINDKPNLEL